MSSRHPRDATRQLVTDLAYIELDRIQVKGKTVPVDIFALLGDDKVAQTEEFKKLNEANQAMIDSYRSQDFKKARDMVAECRTLLDGFRVAGLYDLYEQRLDEFEATPPAADWDGTFIATTK